MSRDHHALAILGPALHARLPGIRVLIVGSGGIGCELLKNVVLTGFGHITLLDLDTIDLSNLNRQFLFRKKDVKQPKSLVAARTAAHFNPRVHIEPLHANIKEPRFDVPWYKSFDIVLNALDNLDARRHVNKMCMAANVPLVESGTAGYFGQVQPIVKDQTECFDCLPKPTPKSFPVCTIRSTPSQPIHCIVWAKSYLFPQLFGEDEDDREELDEAEKQGENAAEIQNLRREAQAFTAVRALLRSGCQDGETSAARPLSQVFTDDVHNLLSMADMWRSRAPPEPLNFNTIVSTPISDEGAATSTSNGHTTAANALRDQKTLTLREMLDMFVSSTNRLATRLSLPKAKGGEETVVFDKDDDDALDFVCAAANLRSVIYGITTKTRWEVKEMAGNIIPAIATTNAVIAGLIVLQVLHILRATQPSTSTSSKGASTSMLRTVHLQHKPTIPLQPSRPEPPNSKCGICRDTFLDVRCHPWKITLGEIVDAVLKGVCAEEGEEDAIPGVTVYEGNRILADPDFDENLDRTLEDLSCGQGKFITIVDEDGEWGTIAVAVGLLSKSHSSDKPALMLPSPMPIVPRKARLQTPSPLPSTAKRPLEEDGEQPPAKRQRTETNGAPSSSPSKGYKEVDGIIIVDDGQDDDIIIIED
ncbi:hypothetical protein JB92DRAFT_2718341 [Gautieria morchelliformis]|nr:hypothetical protein JB92DRAFT_2718341 [Gautieria morchelliformis]